MAIPNLTFSYGQTGHNPEITGPIGEAPLTPAVRFAIDWNDAFEKGEPLHQTKTIEAIEFQYPDFKQQSSDTRSQLLIEQAEVQSPNNERERFYLKLQIFPSWFLRLITPRSEHQLEQTRPSISTESTTMITVSSMPQLMAALASASGPTEILLEPGDYGRLDLFYARHPFAKFSDQVTIKSADPDNISSFGAVDLRGVGNLSFEDIKFDYVSGDGAPVWIKPFIIRDSENISIVNSVFDGDLASGLAEVDNGFGTGFGLSVQNSTDISLEGSEFFNFMRAGVFGGINGLSVKNNNVHDIRSDGFNFADVDNVLIEDNYIHDFRGAEGSADHMDMIQFWTNGTTSPSTNVVIRGNFLDSGEGSATQSIFMRNDMVDRGLAGPEMFYQNITIENNVIYNAHTHGITVGETNGLKIQDNTILQNEDSADGNTVFVPTIIVSGDALNVVVSGNIVPRLGLTSREGQIVQNNLIVQRDNPEGDNYIGDLFVNALADSGANLADLQAVPGGLVEQTGVGASATVFGSGTNGLAGFVSNDAGAGLDILTHSFDASNIFGPEGELDLEGAQITWDFGDGQSGTSLTPAHSYKAAGTYDVTATVTLSGGEVVNLRKTIEVDTPIVLRADFDTSEHDEPNSASPFTTSDQVTFETSGEGQAVRLNGGTAGFRSPELLNNSEYTLFFDFKKDAGEEDAGGRVINFTGSFIVVLGADNIKVALNTTAGSPWLKVDNAGINDAEWHRVALTFSGEDGNAILYLDGQEIARATGLEGGIQTGSPYQNFFLGNPWGEGFPGLIDNVAFLRGAIDPEDANAGLAFVDELMPQVVPPTENENTTPPVTSDETTASEGSEPGEDGAPPEISYNSVIGTKAADVLNGTDGADLIIGHYGKDKLVGGAGDDKLIGAAHADTIEGGDGDDILVGGHDKDTLTGGAGRDKFVFTNSEDSTVGKSDIIKDFDIAEDTLDFSAMGYSGFADPGSEAAFGELTYRYEDGNTIVEDGFGKFQVVLEGVTAFDPGAAQFNSQPVLAGEGDDDFSSYANWSEQDQGGSFILDMKGGDDTVTIKNYRADIIDGGDGNDVISAGHGADIIFGGRGNDSLNGQAHRDILDGGDGDDILNGGHDLDILTGGAGRDTFVFDTASSSSISRSDIVTDFVSGEDVLDLRGLGLSGLSQDGNDGPNFLQSRTEGDKTFLFNSDVGFQVEFLGNVDITVDDLLL